MEKGSTLFRKPLAIDEAVSRVREATGEPAIETVLLHEANGRILATDLIATHDVPAFDKSPYDGFAVRAVDLMSASRDEPVTLSVQYVQGAGHVGPPLLDGHAIRIMTGAKIPDGADAVVMLEIVQADEQRVTFKRPVRDKNISYRGEDVATGAHIVNRGTRINPGIIALLATFGYERVEVFIKPWITVFATGDELAEPGERKAEGQIYNSNAYMILAQIEALGGRAVYGGILPDTFPATKHAIEEALHTSDAIVTTGGVSVGDFDYLPDVYEALGASVLFNKVGMRPGSVTTVANVEGRLLFGLSGNPSACFVGTELFVGTYMKTLYGQAERTVVQAELGVDFSKPNPFDRFVRAHVTIDSTGRAVVHPSGKDKSGIVSSLASCNALIHLPGGTRGFQKGDMVRCRIIDQL
ncbi:molybdopterin molybdenumtransferase MoeA [Exiguobacterium sp. SH1S21]|uniref:molybdopterin molybdotransferase MoeA n=1 Tax=Exiguobacterium sp. SH1S21 TaxID=2510953 RepID=UPI00103DCEF3|nr:gephyrin-like molybdotransferase Glp [Exiguobacterium sp. SH1S21]TCI52891.1 molybdopterin molybdenumtransferase MoeA [Exiguobacterium sp. SH1S21]